MELNNTRTQLEEFLENDKIDSSFMLKANGKFYNFRRLIEAEGLTYKEVYLALYMDMLRHEIKRFEREVWFSGLKTGVDACKWKGYSARPDDSFAVLTYSICGRTLISIYEGEELLTLIVDATSMESTMGLQSFGCSVNKAFWLITKAIEQYKAGALQFEEDRKVGMG